MLTTLKSLKSEDVLEYLTLHGWRVAETQPMWYVLTKEVHGEPVSIYLPTERNTHYDLYLETALQTISALSEAPPERIFDDIHDRRRDILRIRTEVEDTNGIPFDVAAEQIRQLKRIIVYGALAESSSKVQPYYLATSQKVVRDALHAYQFGHTFRGSFGFVIRSPQYKQGPLLQEATPPKYRRILERIARGLAFTQQAVKKHDVGILVEHYKEGFTAEMCEAFAKMGQQSGRPLDIQFNWSPILPAPAEKNASVVYRLADIHYDYLREAATRLKKRPPQETLIDKAHVIEIGVTDDPSKPKTGRTVLLRWYDEANDSTNIARISLSPEDYEKAIKAQKDWRLVRVKGILVPQKGYWSFTKYSSFEILPDDLDDHINN